MEWVETTGRTVADALDAALDELGVHEDDVEVEVLEEPKAGFLGRFGSSDARVRVRLKPISREKPGDRRRRRTKGGGRSRGEGSGRGDGPGRGSSGGRARGGGRADSKPKGDGGSPGSEQPKSGGRSQGGSRSEGGSRRGSRRDGGGESASRENEMDESTVPVEHQAETATGFTAGLVEAFGAEARVSNEIDDGTVTVNIDGSDLGLLVGPRGVTLNAIEELVKAVVQRETGGHGARIHVDVAGYRAKRREALAGFTRGLAQQAIASGEDQVLEPMQAPDRKVVHDTVAELDGVETSSEGEEPRRYVVIRPV